MTDSGGLLYFAEPSDAIERRLRPAVWTLHPSPPIDPERSIYPTLLAEDWKAMWRCSNCHESVDDTFAVCWNCGAAADGTLDSDFTPEPDDPAVREPGEDADSEAAPAQLDAPPQSLCRGGMNRQEIAALICKTLALILFAVAAVLSMTAAFLLGFVLITTPYGHPSNTQDLFVFLVAAVPVLTMVGVGAFYWKKSKSIAALMVSADPRPVAFQVFTVQDAMTVAFSTAGIPQPEDEPQGPNGE